MILLWKNDWFTINSCILFQSSMPLSHFIFHLSMGFWHVPFLLLWRVCSGHAYRCLLVQKWVFLLGVRLAMEFLGHRTCELPIVLKNAYLFSKIVVLIYILICSGWKFLAPHLHQQIIFPDFSIVASQVSVKLCLTQAWNYNSLVTNQFEYLLIFICHL